MSLAPRLLPMHPCHLDRVVALDQRTAHRPWPRAMFQEELTMGREAFCRVLLDGYGSVIGYAVSRLQLDEWHLLTIGVDDTWRRQGMGERLVRDVLRKAALNQARSVLLEVRSSNKEARNLYEKMGFSTLYVRERYYRSGPQPEDAVVMDRRVQKGDREKIA